MLYSKLFLLFFTMCFSGSGLLSPGYKPNLKMAHPFYISVTQIDQNQKDNILEVSCKIFTDDFEKTLRMHYPGHIDLLNPSDLPATNKIVNDYINKHLAVIVDGKKSVLQFIGYEKNEEAVECFLQVNSSVVKKSIGVFNNLLFEYKPEQINIVHVTVNHTRKSRKLANPDDRINFEF